MKKIMDAGFDHPCKQTCSGWKQGYERGKIEGTADDNTARTNLQAAILKITRLQEALVKLKHENGVLKTCLFQMQNAAMEGLDASKIQT